MKEHIHPEHLFVYALGADKSPEIAAHLKSCPVCDLLVSNIAEHTPKSAELLAGYGAAAAKVPVVSEAAAVIFRTHDAGAWLVIPYDKDLLMNGAMLCTDPREGAHMDNGRPVPFMVSILPVILAISLLSSLRCVGRLSEEDFGKLVARYQRTIQEVLAQLDAAQPRIIPAKN